MSRLNDFLTETGIFYVATNDGAQPKLRPFGAHVEVDGVVHFAVGDFKAVYKQMLANPLTEIVACKPDGVWLTVPIAEIITTLVGMSILLIHNRKTWTESLTPLPTR